MNGNKEIPLRTQEPHTLLDGIYSGAPSRLHGQAVSVKGRLKENQTLPASAPRKSGLRLPPDTTLEGFEAAIRDLKEVLGSENVEVTDKPLADGWYIDHPMTHDSFHLIEQEELISSATAFPRSKRKSKQRSAGPTSTASPYTQYLSAEI
jgi:hypothetical protein